MTRVLSIASVIFLAAAIGYAGQTNQANPAAIPAKKKAAKTTQTAQKPKPASATAATPVPGQGGAVVFVDPVTHQIREATPEDIGTLSGPSQATRNSEAAVRATSENAPTQMQGIAGAVGVALGPEFDTYVVVTKSPDGKLKTEEVTGNQSAQERVLPSKTQKSSDGK